MSGRNQQIEGIRGLSMLIVVTYHYVYIFQKHYAAPITSNWLGIKFWGYFGVCIFLLISGYYIFPQKVFGKIRWFISKLLRLWPAYFVAITVFYLLSLIEPLPERVPTLTTYIANVFLIHGFIGIEGVDGAHWYLISLIGCTFVSVLLSDIKRKRRQLLMILWSAAIVLLVYIDFNNSVIHALIKGILKVLGGDYAPMFVAGIALKDIKEKRDPMAFISLGAAFLANGLVMGLVREITFLIAIGLFELAVNNKIKFLEIKAFTWLGMISYSVYVIHQNPGFWIMYRLSHLIGQWRWEYSLLFVPLAVGVGTIIYYTVEKPCAKRQKQIMAKR